MQTFKQIVMLLLLAAALGVVYNSIQQFPLSLFPGNNESVRDSSAPQRQLIELQELQRLMAETRVLLIDARPQDQYHERHLPGAVHLNSATFRTTYEGLLPLIAASQHLVVYDQGKGKGNAITLSALLSENGHADVRILKGGVSAWQSAGLSMEKSLWD